MTNALFYTFSTIAQTLAGAIALLAAFILYRLQGLNRDIEEDAARISDALVPVYGFAREALRAHDYTNESLTLSSGIERHIVRSFLAAILLLGLACRGDLAHERDILFVATRPGGTEDTYALHLADLTTRRLIKADSASSRSLPAWSPDTRSIAFVREFDDSTLLYVLDSVGGTPRRLVPQLRFAWWPDWSPDGQSLLFTAGEQHGVDVHLIHPDGSGLRTVLHDSAADFRCPAWAPDGRRFTLSAYRAGRSSILEVDVASRSTRTLLASDTSYVDCPRWSPRGDAIVFTIDPTPGDIWARWKKNPLEPWRADLAILDLQTGRVRTLVGGPGMSNYGHWSPDAEWIVFQSERHAAPHIDSLPLRDRFHALEIYVVRPNGSDLRRLTGNDYYDGHPSW